MNVFAENFSLSTAIKEHGDEAIKEISAVLSEQVAQVDAAIKKGLSPKDYAKAQQYRVALMAAHSIVALRHHALTT